MFGGEEEKRLNKGGFKLLRCSLINVFVPTFEENGIFMLGVVFLFN